MAHNPQTPKSNSSEENTTSNSASHDAYAIPYSAAFENAVQEHLLGSSSHDDQISITVVADSDVKAQTLTGTFVLQSSIDESSLPEIALEELPLPLNDPRRIYTSQIPGIRLTHPNGHLHGGPGLTPAQRTEFAHDFVARHDLTTEEQMAEALRSETDECLDQLRQRMSDRDDARKSNARIESELAALTDQMDMETRVLNQAKERKRRRDAAVS